MTSPEEALEADIWQALTNHGVTCWSSGPLVDALIVAARRYAAGDDADLTLLRRYILHRDGDEIGAGGVYRD